MYLNYYVSGPIYATSAPHLVLHAGNYSSYALPLSGGTVTGLTSFTASESLNLKGIRGLFSAGSDGQGIHLFSNVVIGDPTGWGNGFSSTPSRGLGTWGGINVAYGTSADSTFYGAIKTQRAIGDWYTGAMRVVNPGGASYATSASSVNGAIKIALPSTTLGSNTMMMFTVNVYTYDGLSFSMRIGGYNYYDANKTLYHVLLAS